ncbi:MAG TPA: FAD-dependent oxidoreductase [Burkholderiales bacterium]|nr:FAD-dependent oxidoreductase [Burkholderiales bacterium]
MIDVAIVGAGVMGASVAYWLTRLQPGISVVLVERDRSFAHASSALSASSIRQQFSSAVNVRMSLFGAQFLREHAIAFNESGYLYLGCDFRAVHAVQRECGADIVLLDKASLEKRFPWLNAAGIEQGSLGVSGEGWFDGQGLHSFFLASARQQGARLLHDEALALAPGGVKLKNDVLQCRAIVNAAGPWARALAASAGIDLPVHARRRTVFVLSCPAKLPGCPLVIDPGGFWFRPDGEVFIAGDEPKDDADDLPLEPDYAEFDDGLWERMAHRVPAFEALRVERAWAGYYEMNLFDQNAIIGSHPARPGLWFINGFSGHGMQHAPAAGRALAEKMLYGEFRSLDLSPLGWERILAAEPLVERNIIG